MLLGNLQLLPHHHSLIIGMVGGRGVSPLNVCVCISVCEIEILDREAERYSETKQRHPIRSGNNTRFVARSKAQSCASVYLSGTPISTLLRLIIK